ncbi:SDR family NAD(P)-dependent oxidoreductase [Pseudomonas sp. TH41]|uniref:SDR family NAD(P)-dependent oxidoreductase n=1 Tax=Pseudomonas sp. TH41 TaxID=2796405 RepID=UPI0019130100|nr:SDR family NAD(P)-dependent oxidoreductase [Pseudomonas sp. TH41]
MADRVADLKSEGFLAEGMAEDLSDERQVKELVEWASSFWGRIDILLNNAGMAMQGSPEPDIGYSRLELYFCRRGR